MGGEQNGSGNNEYPYGCGLDKAGADIKEPGVFAKMAVKERRIPFEIKADPDPFYSEENMRVLRERAAAIRSGKAKLKEHGLLEADE